MKKQEKKLPFRIEMMLETGQGLNEKEPKKFYFDEIIKAFEKKTYNFHFSDKKHKLILEVNEIKEEQ